MKKRIFGLVTLFVLTLVMALPGVCSKNVYAEDESWQQLVKAMNGTEPKKTSEAKTIKDKDGEETLFTVVDIEQEGKSVRKIELYRNFTGDGTVLSVPSGENVILDMRGKTIGKGSNERIFDVPSKATFELTSSDANRGLVSGNATNFIHCNGANTVNVSNVDFSWGTGNNVLFDMADVREVSFTNCDIKGHSNLCTYVFWLNPVLCTTLTNCNITGSKITGDNVEGYIFNCENNFISEYIEYGTKCQLILDNCDISDNFVSDKYAENASTFRCEEGTEIVLKGNTKLSDKKDGYCSVVSDLGDMDELYPNYFFNNSVDISEFTGQVDWAWMYNSMRVNELLAIPHGDEKTKVLPAITGLTGTDDARISFKEFPNLYAAPVVLKNSGADSYDMYFILNSATADMNDTADSVTCWHPEVSGVTPQYQWYRTPTVTESVDGDSQRIVMTLEDAYYELYGEHSAQYSEDKSVEKANWESKETGYYNITLDSDAGVWQAVKKPADEALMGPVLAVRLKKGDTVSLEVALTGGNGLELRGIDAEYFINGIQTMFAFNPDGTGHYTGTALADGIYAVFIVSTDADQVTISDVNISGVDAAKKQKISAGTGTKWDDLKKGYSYYCEITYPDCFDFVKPSLTTNYAGIPGVADSACKIDTTEYGTLEEAFNAIDKADTTIVLMEDNKERIVVSKEISFKIDAAEYSNNAVIEAGVGYEVSTSASGKVITYTISKKSTPIPPKAMHIVSFELNGHGAAIGSIEVREGEKVKKPADPLAAGYTFEGWFTDKELKNAYDFGTPVTKDITLYAKWTKNADPTKTPDPTKQPEPTKAPSKEKPINIVIAKASMTKANAIKLTWVPVKKAAYYRVYGCKCGSKAVSLKKTTNTQYTVKSISGKKLKLHQHYRFYVKAYDKNGKQLVKSPSIHYIAGNTKGKTANVTKVTLNKKSLTLKKGQTYKKLKVTKKVYKNMEHVGASHGTATMYTTTNKKVVTVSKKGVIKAVGKGTAYIYVQDCGGAYAKLKVTVK